MPKNASIELLLGAVTESDTGIGALGNINCNEAIVCAILLAIMFGIVS